MINKQVKKINIKELNKYLDNHININIKQNITNHKEDYDFFSELLKKSVIKKPNNFNVQLFKNDRKNPKKNIKNINQENSVNSNLRDKKSKINSIDFSEFEKHKSNKRTFEEIKSLLLYESKSLSNKLKNLENNKEIGDKKKKYIKYKYF
jgi:hypothetical protein